MEALFLVSAMPLSDYFGGVSPRNIPSSLQHCCLKICIHTAHPTFNLEQISCTSSNAPNSTFHSTAHEAHAGPKCDLGSAGGLSLFAIHLPVATACEQVCANALLHYTILQVKATKSGKASESSSRVSVGVSESTLQAP